MRSQSKVSDEQSKQAWDQGRADGETGAGGTTEGGGCRPDHMTSKIGMQVVELESRLEVMKESQQERERLEIGQAAHQNRKGMQGRISRGGLQTI